MTSDIFHCHIIDAVCITNTLNRKIRNQDFLNNFFQHEHFILILHLKGKLNSLWAWHGISWLIDYYTHLSDTRSTRLCRIKREKESDIFLFLLYMKQINKRFVKIVAVLLLFVCTHDYVSPQFIREDIDFGTVAVRLSVDVHIQICMQDTSKLFNKIFSEFQGSFPMVLT